MLLLLILMMMTMMITAFRSPAKTIPAYKSHEIRTCQTQSLYIVNPREISVFFFLLVASAFGRRCAEASHRTLENSSGTRGNDTNRREA